MKHFIFLQKEKKNHTPKSEIKRESNRTSTSRQDWVVGKGFNLLPGKKWTNKQTLNLKNKQNMWKYMGITSSTLQGRNRWRSSKYSPIDWMNHFMKHQLCGDLYTLGSHICSLPHAFSTEVSKMLCYCYPQDIKPSTVFFLYPILTSLKSMSMKLSSITVSIPYISYRDSDCNIGRKPRSYMIPSTFLCVWYKSAMLLIFLIKISNTIFKNCVFSSKRNIYRPMRDLSLCFLWAESSK